MAWASSYRVLGYSGISSLAVWVLLAVLWAIILALATSLRKVYSSDGVG